MGNQQGKPQKLSQTGKPKKMVHWKSAERPGPPGRPILMTLSEDQPDVVNLSWEKPKTDGGSPIIGYVIEHRRMGSPNWLRSIPILITRCDISISGLEPGWRYQFRAFAENVVGRSDASELSDPLTVTLQRNAVSVPRFIDELKDTNGVEDERIEFRVRFSGQPQPEINWFKDGYEIFSSRRTKIINENDNSVLIIHQLALSDEGEIKCTATNRAGLVITKARLSVQAPPKIRLPRTYEDGLVVESDEILRLKVGIAGQPPPIITWLHNNDVVTNDGRIEILNAEKNSTLKIDPVRRTDRGEYSVSAVNHLGEDITSFMVTVTSKPDPPGKIRLNMSFGRSATLSWTPPPDDGGCKIGAYIVEYYRIGWNVWLKAITTRTLVTTLNDLIEGSEYKFRVKAENPYGLSEPSEESDILFIPDPKRGIVKPKSESELAVQDDLRPIPPRRKTLSPSRAVADASTETPRLSPLLLRKEKPQLVDNEDLHREMLYGTPDQALKMNIRKSPSMNNNEITMKNTKANEEMLPERPKTLTIPQPTTNISPAPVSPKSPAKKPPSLPMPAASKPPAVAKSLGSPTSPPVSPTAKAPAVPPVPPPKSPETIAFAESIKAQLFASRKDKEMAKGQSMSALPVKIPLASPERSTSPDTKSPTPAVSSPNLAPSAAANGGQGEKRSPKLGSLKKNFYPSERIKNTPALQRSAEPVELGVNQNVRRYSGQSFSPIKNAPALAIAIATGLNMTENGFQKINNEEEQSTANETPPVPPPPKPTVNTINSNDYGKIKFPANGRSLVEKQNASTLTNPTIQISGPPPGSSTDLDTSGLTKPASPRPLNKLDKHDDVQTSNEFMVVVFDKTSKVKDQNATDSFELDLEDSLQPPPVSISSPELASLEFSDLRTFPIRRSVSSTELLYERAMARFYEAVRLEEADHTLKREKANKAIQQLPDEKLLSSNHLSGPVMRKRLGSMTEAERLSFEKRSEQRRQSTDIMQILKTPIKWTSKENLYTSTAGKPLSRATGMLLSEKVADEDMQQYGQEAEQELKTPSPLMPRSEMERKPLESGRPMISQPAYASLNKSESFELESDYTESTDDSDADSIERFKMELMARTRSTSPRELETYHPRDMSAGVFTPYRAPTPEQAAIVLNRPVPLPSPDFIPKPILKRPSVENVQVTASPASPINSFALNASGSTSWTNLTPDKSPVNGKEKTAPSLSDKLDITKGIKSFFKRDKRSTTEKNTEENEKLSNPQDKSMAAALAAEEEIKKRTREEEEQRRLEAERQMAEESHAAVDHYSDLVKEISTTHKYHKPIYLDKDQLQKVTMKAQQEGLRDDENLDVNAIYRQRRSQSPDNLLIPPMNNKPRLSISERGQLQHVRATASDLAVRQPIHNDSPSEPSEPSEHNLPLPIPQPFSKPYSASSALQMQPQSQITPMTTFHPINPVTSIHPARPTTHLSPVSHLSPVRPTSQRLPSQPKQHLPGAYVPNALEDESMGQIISETYVENPDGRGRTRIVKVKRVIKRRVPSTTRSRDTSSSRPPSSLGSTQRLNIDHSLAVQQHFEQLQLQQQHQLSHLQQSTENQTSDHLNLSNENLSELKGPISYYNPDETNERVRSAVSYSTDLILFIVACYIYLFKDARLVVPILALMIYRQLGEYISARIPNWMKRKRD